MEHETKADIAYRKHLTEYWYPTSREFNDFLGVGENQGRNIRRRIKSLAADDGHVYGYHPGLNAVMLAPSGNVVDGKAIIDFAAKQAGRAIGGLCDQVRGAKNDKVVTSASADRATKSITSAGQTIENVVSALDWRKGR